MRGLPQKAFPSGGRWPEGPDEGADSHPLPSRNGTPGPPAPQQAHSAPIPNICIQTYHKGPNFSLFEQTQSLPHYGGEGATVRTLGRMRGQVPATPFVGRDDSARRPGLPRFCRRGGTLGRPPPNRRTPPQFPIYVSKRPTIGQISPYLSRPNAFLLRGRHHSAHTGADEGAGFSPL